MKFYELESVAVSELELQTALSMLSPEHPGIYCVVDTIGYYREREQAVEVLKQFRGEPYLLNVKFFRLLVHHMDQLCLGENIVHEAACLPDGTLLGEDFDPEDLSDLESKLKPQGKNKFKVGEYVWYLSPSHELKPAFVVKTPLSREAYFQRKKTLDPLYFDECWYTVCTLDEEIEAASETCLLSQSDFLPIPDSVIDCFTFSPQLPDWSEEFPNIVREPIFKPYE